VALKCNAVVTNVAQLRQRKHLKSAAVRQDRSIPAHELVESAHVADQFTAWPKVKVIRVSQNDLGPDLLQMQRSERFHRALRSDRHEDRRLNFAMPSLQTAPACSGGRICFEQVKVGGHVLDGHRGEPKSVGLAGGIQMDCVVTVLLATPE
jgi:hypothetical protein